MMRVTMFNVGYGDCFLLDVDGRKLIVDFGSKHETSSLEVVAQGLCNLIGADSQADALVTHFHEDHTKGFDKYAGRLPVDKVYVPYLIPDRTGEFVTVKMAVYIYLWLKPSCKSRRLAKSFLRQMEIVAALVTSSTKIIPLRQGDNFRVGSGCFEVLWPAEIPVNELDDLAQFLQEFESTLADEELKSLQDTILGNFKRWSNLLDINHRQWNSLGQPEVEHVTEMERILQSQADCLQRLEEYRASGEAISEQVLGKLRHKGSKLFNDAVNAYSLVFHDAMQGDKLLLMTGDVTHQVIESELKSRFCSRYRAIKVPHHGSHTHYARELPPADHLLFSTKKYGGKRRGYKAISVEYCQGIYAGSQHYCTNGTGFCDFLEAGQRCSNGLCDTPSVAITL